MSDRINRVEGLVEQLLKKASDDSALASGHTTREADVETNDGILTPALVSSEPSQVAALFRPSAVCFQHQMSLPL